MGHESLGTVQFVMEFAKTEDWGAVSSAGRAKHLSYWTFILLGPRAGGCPREGAWMKYFRILSGSVGGLCLLVLFGSH